MKHTVFFLAAGMFLGSCSTQPVKESLQPVEPDLSLEAVKTLADQAIGKSVRWGGSIVAVTNGESSTDLEIVARPLDADAAPEAGDESYGRFIARINEFLDPEVYARGREVTVRGQISQWRDGKIGAYAYRFPIVDAASYHLWPAATQSRIQPNPFHHDPWYYDPWPFYPPYYRYRYYPW